MWINLLILFRHNYTKVRGGQLWSNRQVIFQQIPSFQTQISKFNYNNPNFQAHFSRIILFFLFFLPTCATPLSPRSCVRSQPTRASYLPLVPQLGLTSSSVSSASVRIHQKVWSPLFIHFRGGRIELKVVRRSRNVHAHPPSRGGGEEEVEAEGSPTPEYELLCWHQHPFFCSMPCFLISIWQQLKSFESPPRAVPKPLVFKGHLVASAFKIFRNFKVIWLKLRFIKCRWKHMVLLVVKQFSLA